MSYIKSEMKSKMRILHTLRTNYVALSSVSPLPSFTESPNLSCVFFALFKFVKKLCVFTKGSFDFPRIFSKLVQKGLGLFGVQN